MATRLLLSWIVGGLGLAGCGSGGDGTFDLGGTPPPRDNLPAYCDPVKVWPPAWEDFEDEVLRLTNERRAAGATCGSHGTFAGASAFSFDENLRCAARVQSKDLGDRGFFDHVNPDGQGPDDRITLAGYAWMMCGENIAAGQPTPDVVVDGWMASEGHCANIMEPELKQIGVGYYYLSSASYKHYWTQNFGTP